MESKLSKKRRVKNDLLQLLGPAINAQNGWTHGTDMFVSEQREHNWQKITIG